MGHHRLPSSRHHVREAPKSRLRAVHNVAGGPNVDLFVDSKPVLSNVPYKAISDYLLLDSGQHNIAVFPVNDSAPLVEVSLKLDPNTSYTALVHGDVSEGQIDVLALEDNLNCPSLGDAHLRFVHAAATVPAVDIYANDSLIFENVSYGQTGRPTYLPVPSGTYYVDVKPANTDDVAFSAKLTFEDGGIYTVTATGLLNNEDTPVSALVSEDGHGMCVVI